MTPRQAPSPGDQALADAATAHGVQVTARQVERWRHNGRLPRRNRQFLGRGRGSVSEPDPPEVVYQVLAVRQLLDAREPSTYIAAELFGQGFLVQEKALRDSYIAILDDIQQFIADEAQRVASRRRTNPAQLSEPSDEADIVGAAVSRKRPRGRRGVWKQRLAAADRPPSAWPATMFQLFDLMYAGTPASQHDLHDLVVATGLSEIAEPSAVEDAISAVSLDRLRVAATAATMTDFVLARTIRDEVMAYVIQSGLGLSATGYTTVDELIEMDALEHGLSILVMLCLAIDILNAN